METETRIHRCGVVPVVVLEREEYAVPTAQALLAGGIDVMEITFRTEAAPGAIAAVHAHCPEMLVGAGTVLNVNQARIAAERGAGFLVSPGFDHELALWCREQHMPLIPGCVTPTEIMAALSLGIHIVKFFPADVYGGLKAMKALSGPFGGIRFMPTGGVSAENAKDYLTAPFVHAVGGSWLCPKKAITEGDFAAITRLSREARTLADACR